MWFSVYVVVCIKSIIDDILAFFDANDYRRAWLHGTPSL